MTKRYSIIVLDDHDLGRDQLVLFLETQGWLAHGVGDVAAFYQALDQQAFDLAILDVTLPEVSGLKVAEQLQRSHPNMGLMVLTAHSQWVYKVQSQAQQGIQLPLGLHACLTKPVDIGALSQAIHALAD